MTSYHIIREKMEPVPFVSVLLAVFRTPLDDLLLGLSGLAVFRSSVRAFLDEKFKIGYVFEPPCCFYELPKGREAGRKKTTVSKISYLKAVVRSLLAFSVFHQKKKNYHGDPVFEEWLSEAEEKQCDSVGDLSGGWLVIDYLFDPFEIVENILINKKKRATN
ncbi:MAG: hypothetical protein MI784_17010 [Cytophagales bacterium]|nr:hypothetical protein [Cytophagales bacterium]